jgi:transposase InsO family protein
LAQGQTEEGRPYLLVAIDRTGQVAFAELPPRAKRRVAADLLRRVLQTRPYQVPTVLTDTGVPFTLPPPQFFAGGHRFERVCRAVGVAHRLTKPAHPWTKGQVERLNRTLKEATGQRYPDQTTAQRNAHLHAFLLAYHPAKRLKRLRGLTPHEFVCVQGQKNSTIFTRDPTHLTRALYTTSVSFE